MCKTAHGKYVLQLCGKASVGVGTVGVVFLRLVRRLRREKRGVVCALAMNKRNKSVIGKFLFATVRDGHLGRAFHRHFTFVGLERMGRKAVDQTTALDA